MSAPGAVPDPIGGDGGIWVQALPLPNDEQMESEERRLGFANRFLRTVHPGDALDPGSVRETKLAGADALAWEISTEGEEATGRRGEVRLAVLRDTVLAVEVGGPATAWESLQANEDRLLGGLRLPPAVVKFALRPAQPELASVVAARYKGSVPQIWADARANDSVAGGAPTDPHELVSYGSGTGFVVSADGYVVTNRHVVARGGDEERTRFLFDPVWLKWDPLLHRGWDVADVVAVSRQWDLALLKIRGEGPWTPMPLADPDHVAEAQQVLVMGWPAADGKETELLHHNWNIIASVERDSKMRPRVIRHGARTTRGNSGGPVYDLELGGIIGVHSRGYISTAHDFDDMFQHGAVPADRILWEFPQIFTEEDEGLTPDAHIDRIAHFFQQERFGAATLECRRLLEEDAKNGTAHAYLLRMLHLQGEPLYAATHFEAAVADPASRVRAHLFAARSALEEGDTETLGKQAALAASSARELGKETPETTLMLAHALSNPDLFEIAFEESGGTDPEARLMQGASLLRKWLIAHPEARTTGDAVMPEEEASVIEAMLLEGLNLGLPDARGHAYLGLLGDLRGMPGVAGDLFAQAVNLGGYDAEVRTILAYDALLGDRSDEAAIHAYVANSARPTVAAEFLGGAAQVRLARTLEALDADSPERRDIVLLLEKLGLPLESALLAEKGNAAITKARESVRWRLSHQLDNTSLLGWWDFAILATLEN